MCLFKFTPGNSWKRNWTNCGKSREKQSKTGMIHSPWSNISKWSGHVLLTTARTKWTFHLVRVHHFWQHCQEKATWRSKHFLQIPLPTGIIKISNLMLRNYILLRKDLRFACWKRGSPGQSLMPAALTLTKQAGAIQIPTLCCGQPGASRRTHNVHSILSR